MRQPRKRLFDFEVRLDQGSLCASLFLHAQAVEECLSLAGHASNAQYDALDLIRVAATLMTANPEGSLGFPRWLLPQQQTAECCTPNAIEETDDDLPF